MEIYAISIKTHIDDRQFRELAGFLDARTRERLDRFYKREDALRSLYGEILVRYQLSCKLKVPVKDLTIEKSDYGKPFLAHYPDTHFNMSHSGDWACCAIDDNEIGIDVETIKPIDLYIADRFFSQKEVACLHDLPDDQRQDRFFDIWTLKESYIKAVGRGLSVPLCNFSILFNGNTIGMESDKEPACYFFRQYDLEPGYKLAVCAGHDGFPVNLRIETIDDLYNRLCDAGRGLSP
ncbi:MAG: 4'-phosphopantetheinyl transferase superfamily protein [Spirochaetales bacterium]|nr:4'-phosphopantetheinyl transferase superfamily protein [Spirochaetales bacterium]